MAEIKKPRRSISPGLKVEGHELEIDDAAIQDVLARGMPTGAPPMLEDTAESKKAFIDYFKRKKAGIYLSLAPLREKVGQKNVKFSDYAEEMHNIHLSLIALGKETEAGSTSSIAKAEAGSSSGGLINKCRGTLPSDSDSDSTPL